MEEPAIERKAPHIAQFETLKEEFTFTICARKMEVRRRSHTMEELREDSWIMVVVMVERWWWWWWGAKEWITTGRHRVSISPPHSICIILHVSPVCSLNVTAKEFQQQGTALQDLSQKVGFYQQGHDLKHWTWAMGCLIVLFGFIWGINWRKET